MSTPNVSVPGASTPSRPPNAAPMPDGPLDPGHGTLRRVSTAVATVLLFALAFFVLQRVTFALRFPPFERTTIWTPGALLFAALLLEPPGRWWRYYVGTCVGAVAAYAGDEAIPAPTALFAAQFLVIAVVIGAVLVRRLSPGRQLASTSALLTFVIVAGIVVPIATTGPIDLLRWRAGADDVWPVALRSFLCISLGVVIATPAITLTLREPRMAFGCTSRWCVLEGGLLLLALLAVGHVAFGRLMEVTAPAMLYLPVPVLVWAAVRFRLAGASWALLIMAYQSTWGAINGLGPFVSGAFADNVLGLQLFILASSIPLMILAVVIQQRSDAFESLARSEAGAQSQLAQLEAIYQEAPTGLAFIAPDLRLVKVNDCFAEMSGRSAVDQIDRRVQDALPELAGPLDAACRSVLDSGEPVVDVEFRRPTATGDAGERVWRARFDPVRNALGELLGVSSVVEEITERRRIDHLRQELIHASRVALLGEFSASLAHEINQPLGAIVANAEAASMLLEGPADGATHEEFRRIVTDISRDGLRAGGIVKGLRAMVRRNTSGQDRLRVNDLVRETAALVHGEARRRQVELRLDLADQLPEVLGDRIQLQQVLMNLLANGLDALAERVVDCETRELDMRTAATAAGVCISVSDSGPGIPSDRIDRVFDHYFSTKSEGMGLGLAIARSIVENHHGSIEVSNRAEGGTLFRVTLPPAHAMQESDPTPRNTTECRRE